MRRWAHMDEFDQDEWLEHLEEHLKEIVNISGKDVQYALRQISRCTVARCMSV